MNPDDESLPPFVLALTIVRSGHAGISKKSPEDEVLYCVRDPSVNLTHPDVVSVPTQRIPESLGDELSAMGKANGTFGETQLLSSETASNRDDKGHNPMIYAVESLLAGKMGMANHLESNRLTFTAQLAGRRQGRARYPKKTGENPDINDDEELRMINLLVRIDKGADLFPDKTLSYYTQAWATKSDFMKVWDDKDATLIGLTVYVCIDGLCIASTYDVLSAINS